MPPALSVLTSPPSLLLLLEQEDVEARRYLVPRRLWPKAQGYMSKVFHGQSEHDFRKQCRMDCALFQRLVDQLSTNPIFYNNSYAPQAPVAFQLACALECLGKNGTGASGASMKRAYGFGYGTVRSYAKRVIEALNDLAPEVITWPTTSAKAAIKEAFGAEGFPGCIGLIDGTGFPLSQRPALCGEMYYDRKKRYSISAQVICDHQRRITNMHIGYPGSCADVTVYKEMDVCKRAALYFNQEEYLLADSAYPITTSTVPLYKRIHTNDPENRQFNLCGAHVRVANEHCIGMLKNRFSSLKELRIILGANLTSDVKRIVSWVNACAVLHNLLINWRDV